VAKDVVRIERLYMESVGLDPHDDLRLWWGEQPCPRRWVEPSA